MIDRVYWVVFTLVLLPRVQVEARQKLLEAKDKEEAEVEDKKAQIDEDAPSNG